jgi:hypothetical protein
MKHNRKRSAGDTVATLLLGAALVALPGCPKAEPRASQAATELPLIKRDTPELAAQTAMFLIQTHVQAAALKDATLAKQCLDNLVSIMDAPAIEASVKASPSLRSMIGESPIRGMAENWIATLAYYAGSFEITKLGPEEPDKPAVVVALAGVPPRSTSVRIDCARRPDGQWAIRRIILGPPNRKAPPASGPVARQPAAP